MTFPTASRRPALEPEMAYDPPRAMKHWTVQVTCPECGGLLEHIADGRPDGWTARAVARCTGCEREWKAELTLSRVTQGRIGRQVA